VREFAPQLAAAEPPSGVGEPAVARSQQRVRLACGCGAAAAATTAGGEGVPPPQLTQQPATILRGLLESPLFVRSFRSSVPSFLRSWRLSINGDRRGDGGREGEEEREELRANEGKGREKGPLFSPVGGGRRVTGWHSHTRTYVERDPF